MPLKLYEPDANHPTWRVRGKYLGVSVDRSTGTRKKKVAAQLLAKWQEDIERGAYAKPQDPTFASAALSYMQAGGDATFLQPVIKHFGVQLLHTMKQADIDAAAVTLYPEATAATRNRQVYTPVSAVMHHAGMPYVVGADGGKQKIKRPKGSGGTPRTCWLSPEQAFALLAAAQDQITVEAAKVEAAPTAGMRDAAKATENNARRFKALCMFLLYTGCRLGEALRVRPKDVELQRSFLFCGKTKNGKPRPVHLPPQVVAELANMTFGAQTIFSMSKGGRLYDMLRAAAKAAGVVIPPRVAFHIFRHTYGAWMRRYGGLDTSGLVGTGAWRSRAAAAIYEHVETTEEAQKADLLPTPDLGDIREIPAKKEKS